MAFVTAGGFGLWIVVIAAGPYGNNTSLTLAVSACVASAAALIFERVTTGTNV